MQLSYLRFTADLYSQDWNADLDYAPLTEIESLRQIFITSNEGFDSEDCDLLLRESGSLELIEISYTAAADDVDEFQKKYQDISIVSYGKID